MAPGDPITIMAGMDNPNQDMINALTEKYGLDQPVYVQFGIYLKNLLKGDFGYSYRTNQSVLKLIGDRIGPTLLMTLTAAFLSVIIGTAIGLMAARKKDTMSDQLLGSISYIFDAMPSFWLALILILLFASRLSWFPTAGMVNLRANYTGFRYALDVLYHMFLPVLCLSLLYIPSYFRITRSSVLQVMNEDYNTLFRATGMSQKKIFRSFVLKNAILPTVTIFGTNLAWCFAGASLVEIVFAWPGMGRLLLDSITKRDYPVVTGIYLIVSVLIVVITVLMDMVYAYLDPRIRLK